MELLVFSGQTHFIKKGSVRHSSVYYTKPPTTAFLPIHSQPPCAAFSTKETKGSYQNHHELRSLCWEVWDSLSCGLGPCTAPRRLVFIWDLNILGKREPSFLLSCHFPALPQPLAVMGIWQAPSMDSQTTGGTWFQFLHPVIGDSWDILFLQG